MKLTHQCSSHLRSDRQDRILHNLEPKNTMISIMKYGHAYEGEKPRDGHHILHNVSTSLSYEILNSIALFWHTLQCGLHTLDKRFCKDDLYKSNYCKNLNIADLVWYILHLRHHTIDKRYCKGSLYKSQPFLIPGECRCREPFGNYRKYSLWLRVRDYREEEKNVNCTHF